MLLQSYVERKYKEGRRYQQEIMKQLTEEENHAETNQMALDRFFGRGPDFRRPRPRWVGHSERRRRSPLVLDRFVTQP